jgi:hypothetical protein
MAFEVRSCGTMHRLRDTASEWPIRVRVTTANAGCVSTRILNVDRRRPMVKAVPARAPTGSSWSLPPCRRERNPRHPPSHAHVSARRAMSATRAPGAGGLKAEDRVIACPKGPAIGHAHRHHRNAVTLAARPLRRSGGAGQVRCGDHARDRVRARLVIDYLRSRGDRLHEAYTTYGSTRVSCAFCIMGSEHDLRASAGCADSVAIYREMMNYRPPIRKCRLEAVSRLTPLRAVPARKTSISSEP